MDKLELKHLAPYLPYGLKFGNTENDIIVEMKARSIGVICANTELYKPIFRPLSDLTKKIEHNGDKFVAMEKLFGEKTPQWGATIKHLGMPGHWEYHHIEKLFEWHFDVFGLIEAGLAIEKVNDQEKEAN